MNLPDAPPTEPPPGLSDEALERALCAWTAPLLPDDGFTEAVLQRVAQARAHAGLAQADALRLLRKRQQQQARQLRCSGCGLALGVALALAWLPVGSGWLGGGMPWLLWLGAALAGATGALTWLSQQPD